MSQRKKFRVFSPETKLKIVERMLAGESTSALARELKIRRKLVYEWRDNYLRGGPGALRTRGRPRKDQALGLPPEALSERGELLQARQRIAELERKVGHQEMQIDFFVEALRRVEAVREKKGKGVDRCMPLSESKRSKAD